MIVLELADIRRSFGWSAYAGAALAIIGNIALSLFYALELPNAVAGGSNPHVFGPISDYAELCQYLVMMPLPLALHRLVATRDMRTSQVAIATGVAGLSIAAVA